MRVPAQLRSTRALLAVLVLGAPLAGAQRMEQADLERLLPSLEARYAGQRAQFDDAARRPLPAKARARLEQARAAHAAGQGRLIELLRERAFADAALLAEQLALASARQPISSDLLRVRAPRLAGLGLLPEASADGGAAGSEAAAAPIGNIPPAVKAVADSLAGLVEVYAFVRNGIRPEFYRGSLKGPLQTLYDAAGNDADSAALLIALLRAKGLPARFVVGTVELTAARLRAVTGTGDGNAAVQVLERGGIPHEVVLGPGGVERVKLERVWAEAYVPYVNYRGALLDNQGQAWVPLDAGFKALEEPRGFDAVAELGLDPLSLVDEYLSQPQAEAPRVFVKRRLGELLAQSNRTLDDARNSRGHLSEQLGLLPATLPYRVEARGAVSFEAPLAHSLHVRGERAGVVLLDAELPLSALLGQRLTVGYEPFEADDWTTVEHYGGLSHTPPYLVEVRAVLRSGGVTVATGAAPIGMAVPYELTVELRHPGGTEQLSNRVLAGNLTAIGLGGRSVAGHETQSTNAAALLARVAEEYLKRWNEADADLADVLRVAPVRPTASACFVASDVEVEYASGDEEYPLTFDWKGVFIDADLRSSAPVAIGEAVQARAFTLWSGLEGSVQEHRAFEQLWGVESISTGKALQLAAQAGTPVLQIDASNVGELELLPLDEQVKAEIREAALRGYTVRVPADTVTHLAWTGVGYWILDPPTGEAAYQLQGGHSGGVTAPAVSAWPGPIKETLIDQGEAPAAPGTGVARLVKFMSTDFQDGLVDKELQLPLRVVAVDVLGQRVPQAPVTFVVLGGGGAFVDPATGEPMVGSFTTLTNERGEASARLRLGKSTSEIPRFACLEEDPDSCSPEAEIFYTQIGLNLVTAYTGGAQLEAPFQAYSIPDDEFDGTFRYWHGKFAPGPFGAYDELTLRVVGPITLLASDRFGNPLSNAPVRFAFSPPPEPRTLPEGWVRARPLTTSPGYLLSVKDYQSCTEITPWPGYGDCAGEVGELTVMSSHRGAPAYASLGDSTYSLYFFDVGTEAEPTGAGFTAHTQGDICPDSTPCLSWPQVYVAAVGNPTVVGSDGRSIEARAPGGRAELTYNTQAVYEGYTIERSEDSQGVHYYARGNNTWSRAPLEDSQVVVTPLTPGTAVADTPVPHIEGGLYRSELILASEPGVNEASTEIKSTPWEMPWKGARGGELDPAAVDYPNQTVQKRKFPQWPAVNRWAADQWWGVLTQIQEVLPSPVRLDAAGRVIQASSVSFTVDPASYVDAIQGWTRLSFKVKQGEETVLEADGADTTPFTIPAGLPLETGDFVAQVEIPFVSYDTHTGYGSIVSAPFGLPICSGLKLNTPVVVLPVVDDPPANSPCDTQPVLRFEVCSDSRVTLLVEGQPAVARLDGAPVPVTLVDVPVGSGAHEIAFEPNFLRVRDLESAAFLLRAVDAETAQAREAEGTLLASGEILKLVTPEVSLKRIRDLASGTTCPVARGVLAFAVCQDVSATIRVEGFALVASLDGGPEHALQDESLTAGVHVARLPQDYMQSSIDGQEKKFEVAVVATADPSIQDEKTGVIKVKQVNRAVAAVGHTLVHGVDLSDGHVALDPVTDLSLPGRHLAFNLTRSYTSAGQSSEGEFGAGWGWTYGLHLDESESETCGLVSLSSLSGGQVFRGNAAIGYTAERGHHGSLTKDPDGPSFDYRDKANNLHHFEAWGVPPEQAYRIKYVEEPHGDRLTYVYGDRDRVEKIVEELNGPGGRTPVRELRLTYRSVLGTDRIETAEIVALAGGSLALAVTYTYDEYGNLLTATRSGQNVGGPGLDDLVWNYKYDTTDGVDRHQLVEVQDPNHAATGGGVTQYQYYRQIDPFPGEPGVAIERKAEYVKAVRHFDPREVKTGFVYDQTEAQQNRIKTTVKDPKGFDRLHTLDSNGQELQLDEPLGKQTVSTWDSANVVKVTETDTLGRLTTYGHDAKGNRTSEAITTADLADVTQTASYDGTFNKLTSKTDREGRTTVFTVDPEHGDTVGVTDAAGNPSSMAYDDFGLLQSTTDPRNHTVTYELHDSYGHWTRMTDALGNMTTREYDARGRLLKESDTLGRETRWEYDALDRKTSEVKVAGGASGDMATAATYYPGGEKKEETSGNGARTVYTLDGMNRVTQTATYFDRGINRTTTTHDLNGNTETETDVAGVRRRHTYDALNRRVGTAIEQGPAPGPVGAIASLEYNLVGAQTAETDLLHAARTDLSLDGLYRTKEKLLPESMPAGYSPGGRLKEAYGLDKADNLLSKTDPNGHVVARTYDALDRVTSETIDPGGLNLVKTTRYCNEPAPDPPSGMGINKCEEHDQRTGLRTLFEYDELDRVTQVKLRLEGPDGDPAVDEYTTSTTYDDNAHTATVTDPRGTQIVIKRDGLDQVVETTIDSTGLNLTTKTAYDGLGLKKSQTDARGNTSYFRQDGLGRTWRVTDAAGQASYFEYFEDGQKKSETDREGIKKTLSYDNLRRLTSEALAAAPKSGVMWSRTVEHLDAQLERRETNANGHATTFKLDKLGRVLSETDADVKTAVAVWDGVNKREQSDKRANRTKYEYDAADRLVKTTDPVGVGFGTQTAETTYLDDQNQERSKDRRGTLTLTQKDSLGRVRSVIRARGTADQATESSSYDENSNRTLSVDAAGSRTAWAYDRGNRQTSEIKGEGSATPSTTTYTLDKNGNAVAEQDQRAADLGLAYSLKRTFDKLNRVTDLYDPEGNHTVTGYDREGRRTLLREPKGQETRFVFDELGKAISVTQPGTPAVRFEHDPGRNLTRWTDADGRVVTMEYDLLERLKRTTRDPGGLNLVASTTAFDEDGRALTMLEPNGAVTHQTWDELGRLKTRSFDAAASWLPVWRYTVEERHFYDENSNLQRVEERDLIPNLPDPPARVTSRTFDALDRQTSETFTQRDGSTRTVSSSYYPNGLVQTATDPLGTTSYTYDGQNRERTVTTAAGITTKTYFGDGLVKDISFPNGTTRTQLYDKADRLTSMVTTKPAEVVASVAYSYDRNGNRLTETKLNGGAPETTGYGYDDLNRLKQVTYAVDPSHPNGRKVAYGYDGAGNRTSEIVTDPVTQLVLESRTGIFDNANRLTQLTDNLDAGQTSMLDWDANGNLKTETKAGVATHYGYDLRDTLSQVERGPDTLVRFLGDWDERRVVKIGDSTHPLGTGVQEYLYHDARLANELEGGNATARYEWTNEELISLFRSDGTRRYYTLDGLETVLALTDEQGVATDRLGTDAWGVPKPGTDFGSSGNRFLFTSHRWDAEAELYYAGGRMYNPTVGRFITQDNLSLSPADVQTWNLFQYANDNPTRFVDPTGHAPEDPDSTVSAETLKKWEQYAQEHPVEGAPEGVTVTESRTETCRGVLCPVVEPILEGGSWVLDNTLGRVTRWLDKKGTVAGAKVREHIVNQEPSEHLLAGRRQMTEGLPPEILAVDQGTQQLGTRFQETKGELAEAGTRGAIREGGVAIVTMGTNKLLGKAAEAAEGALPRPARLPSAGSGPTRIVYSIRDAEGRVIYVGRASGRGTPQQVLARRVSAHDHKTAGRFQIEEVNGSYQANRGAEEVTFTRERLAAESEGRRLLNKDNPISPRNPRQGEYVDEYNREWLRAEQPK